MNTLSIICRHWSIWSVNSRFLKSPLGYTLSHNRYFEMMIHFLNLNKLSAIYFVHEFFLVSYDNLNVHVNWTFKCYKAYHKSGSMKWMTSCQFKICTATTTRTRMETTNLLYILDKMISSIFLFGFSTNLNEGKGMKTFEWSAREVWCLVCLLYNKARAGRVNRRKQIEVVEMRTPYFQFRLKTMMVTIIANLNK